jgi:EAL domain-containing protein (putative c-di-GMP-specific phosphodiesterase class I)
LTEEGCDQLQGFYFSRPVTAMELGLFIENWTGFDVEPVVVAA